MYSLQPPPLDTMSEWSECMFRYLMSRVRSPVSPAKTNLITTLIVIVKRTKFDTLTSERTGPYSTSISSINHVKHDIF